MNNDFALFNAQQPADWARWARRNVDVSDGVVSLDTRPTLEPRLLGTSGVTLAPLPGDDLLLADAEGQLQLYLAAEDRTSRIDLIGGDSDGSPSLVGATAQFLYLVEASTGTVGEFSRRTRRLERTVGGVVEPISVVGGTRALYLLDVEGDGGVVRRIEPESEPTTVVDQLDSPLDMTLGADGTLFVLAASDDQPVVVVATPEESGGYSSTHQELAVGEFVPELVAAWGAKTLLLYGKTEADPEIVVYSLAEDRIVSRRSLPWALSALQSEAPSARGDDKQTYGRTVDEQIVTVEQGTENRKDPESTRYEGHLLGRFDSGERDLEWHRIAFDIARAASGTHVDVQYFADNGDSAPSVTTLDGLTEDHGKQLGAIGVETLWELIEHTPSTLAEVVADLSVDQLAEIRESAHEQLLAEFEAREETNSASGPTDLLLRDATGRQLHILVKLVGSRQSSPQLHALTAYCPRQTYLRYLPEIYQQSDRNRQFLSRFLSIFETVFTDIEANIDRGTKFIDPYEIPKDYFPWLNRWFGGEAVLGRAWPETAQRELLERSTELYKLRGTKRGMRELIGLYLDHVDPRESPWVQSREQADTQLSRLVEAGYLTEADRQARLDEYDSRISLRHEEMVIFREYEDIERIEDPEYREQYAELFGHPRRFQVLIWPTLSERHVGVIKTIINADKPVYTDVFVEQLRKDFRINTNTYLGINTYLPDTQFSVDDSALGADAKVL